GKQKNNYTIVDVGWTLGLVIMAWVFYFFCIGSWEKRILITSLVSFWGIRLGSHLFITRILKGHKEDERYASFREDYGDKVHRKFFTNIFQFQALLDVILSIPFFLIANNPKVEFEVLEIAGVILFILAFAGESLADYQLNQFKKDPSNQGKNCEVGLWYYSRHPNYFFEWLVWVSWSLISLAAPYGYFGLISPILMYIFLTRFTGIPMTEKIILKKRGEAYREYQR
ncbi:MAG: DUF1295 domain-containing protein, partial [Leptospiraceae bacterium]|nr:DUF1295 domain-containing protein [Leptospiraceae bacterium]